MPLTLLGRPAALLLPLMFAMLTTACAPLRPATPPVAAEPPAEAPRLRAASWGDLPGWAQDQHAEALATFLSGCKAVKADAPLQRPCVQGALVAVGDDGAARAFFEAYFEPLQLLAADGGEQGLITGYYEPEIAASRQRGGVFQTPIHGLPDDLLVVDLAALDPDLKGKRLRGRLDGRRVVPYPSRGEIVSGTPLPAPVLAWAADPVDLFFMQIQGSGRLRLDDGAVLRLGYADQNGHPYRPVGRTLVDRGELSRETVSMQSIRAWLESNPGQRDAVLDTNPSYVFFRELPASDEGPIGSLGVPLRPARSIAIDPKAVQLGSPVWLDTRDPVDGSTLQRLMSAQDTGGAIRGNVRADVFWGRGDAAAERAGRMREPGRMWLLRPIDLPR